MSHGFEEVGEAFTENSVRRRELAGPAAPFHCGKKVIELWGGIRNKRTGEP